VALIEFEGVSKSYAGSAAAAVAELNLQVEAGEFLTLLGPSGSGKTTTLMLLAGRRYYPAGAQFPVVSFVVALVIATWSILSIGFLIAAVVPTARFAQPIGAVILYPMFVLSGLFIPITLLPSWLRHLPLTYAVSLLLGIWQGEPWSAHVGDVIGLVVVFVVCTALSARVFRWE